jgi:tetratricopeptide (TPR) repeat protein
VPLALFVYRPIEGVESFANSHLSLGIALELQGKPASALEEYRRGLALEPGHPKLLRRAGLLLADAATSGVPADEAEVLDLLAQAVRADPDHVELRYRLATALAQVGELERAARQFEEILARGESPPGVHANLAIAYDRLDRAAEAERHARVALEESPGDPAMLEILSRRGN